MVKIFHEIGSIDKLNESNGRNPRKDGQNKGKRKYPFGCADRRAKYAVERTEHGNTAD